MEIPLSEIVVGVAVWAGASFLRFVGGILQVLSFFAVYIAPRSARVLVQLLAIRYPRAKEALLDQVDELLEEPNWLKRRGDVLDGIGGMLAQARHLQRAEQDAKTRTEPPPAVVDQRPGLVKIHGAAHHMIQTDARVLSSLGVPPVVFLDKAARPDVDVTLADGQFVLSAVVKFPDGVRDQTGPLIFSERQYLSLIPEIDPESETCTDD